MLNPRPVCTCKRHNYRNLVLVCLPRDHTQVKCRHDITELMLKTSLNSNKTPFLYVTNLQQTTLEISEATLHIEYSLNFWSKGDTIFSKVVCCIRKISSTCWTRTNIDTCYVEGRVWRTCSHMIFHPWIRVEMSASMRKGTSWLVWTM